MQIFIQLVQLFLIYAFLGWCCEVVFAASTYGKFVNRGFLNGPYCPIYGLGVLAVLFMLKPVSNSLGLLFIGAVIVTSALEWLTGFLSYKLLHVRLWDYTDQPFNIGGHICLRFSLLWGISCILIVRVIHPIIYNMVVHIPHMIGLIVTAILMVLFIADTVITMIGALKLPRRLKAIDELEDAIREVSDKLGLGLSELTWNVKEHGEKSRTAIETNYAEELQRLKEKQQKLLSQQNRIHNRLIQAYPALLRGEKRGIFEKIRNFSRKKD